MIVENLFPIAIGMFNSNEKIPAEVLENQTQRINIGNTSSENTYLLNDKRLSSLRHFIEKSLFEYFMATFAPKNDVNLKITQSWLNWTKPGQHHHKHSHPNSLISGCFYVNANKNTDKIFFFKEDYRQLVMPPIEWNAYNSESWWYPVGSGDLILFPSSLTHMVQPVEGDETRISLAFNTFPIGMIGDESQLSGLRLER